MSRHLGENSADYWDSQESGPDQEVVDLEGASFYPTCTRKRGRRQTTPLPLIRFNDYLHS